MIDLTNKNRLYSELNLEARWAVWAVQEHIEAYYVTLFAASKRNYYIPFRHQNRPVLFLSDALFDFKHYIQN